MSILGLESTSVNAEATSSVDNLEGVDVEAGKTRQDDALTAWTNCAKSQVDADWEQLRRCFITRSPA